MVTARRFIDLALICVHGVLVGFAFGLPLASLSSFVVATSQAPIFGLDSKPNVYGVLVAIYGIGVGVGAVVGGIWSRARGRKRHHVHLAVSDTVLLVGSIVYWFAFTNVYVLAAGRIIQGIGSGMLNVGVRSFVQRSTEKKAIIFIMSSTGFFVTIAMGVGPALGSFFATLPPSTLFNVNDVLVARLDLYRLPAVALCIMSLMALVSLAAFSDAIDVHEAAATPTPINESDERHASKYDADDNIGNDDEGDEFIVNSSADIVVRSGDVKKAVEAERMALLGESATAARTDTEPLYHVLMYVLVFILSSTLFAVFEALATPVMMDQFGVDVKRIGYLFLLGGGSSSVAFVIISFLLRPDAPRHISLVNSIVMFSLLLFTAALVYLSEPQDVLSAAVRDAQQHCHAFDGDRGACEAAHQCVWNRIDCERCAPVCRYDGARAPLGVTLAAFACVSVAFTIGRVVAGGAFMRAIHHLGHKGVRNDALMVAAGAVARALGPIAAVAAYNAETPRSPFAVMIGGASLSFVAMIMYGVSWICSSRRER